MKYFSTFSGIGGFELGIKQAYENTCRPNNNCDIIKGCDVNNVNRRESSTRTTNQRARIVSDGTSLSGDKTIKSKVSQQGESTTPCGDRECLQCTEEYVNAVVKERNNSSLLNTSDRTDTKTGNVTEQGICTSSHSKKKTLINTKYSATTATMQEDDMENVPTCVGFSEIDKYAASIYQRHFPNHKNFGDITTINEKELPDFDLFVGGFPCQSFSIAGKRGGFNDTRGTMFFEIARIVREKQPRLLLLENVKGLLSHDQGRTFTTIISTLDELGYDLQWQVLNSKNHGVPHHRERVFIIGHLRGTRRPEVFPFGEANNKSIEKVVNRSQCNTIAQLNQPTHSNDRVYGTDGISPTLNTMQGGNRQPFIKNPKMMNYKKDYENSVAITATSYKEPPVVNAIRRLTPTECERLQGFPDGWTEGVSDTQRYKTLGNAVTVNVIRDIMKKLLGDN